MNFQRSIKSVKALALVAATAATMMATTAAPSQAQVGRRTITFHNHSPRSIPIGELSSRQQGDYHAPI
jgi:hypothetical protein